MKDFGSSAGTIAAEPSIAFQVRRDQPRQPGDGIRVLVIEDSFMIVSMLEMVFEGFGWTMAGPATRVATALELVQSETYDVALLDLNLDGEMSWPVAAALRARRAVRAVHRLRHRPGIARCADRHSGHPETVSCGRTAARDRRPAGLAVAWHLSRAPVRDRTTPMHLNHDPAAPPADTIGFEQFLHVDIRIGTVIAAEPYPEARKPSLKLRIDFGPGIGEKKTSAQIAALYAPEDMIGRQVAAVVNFPPRQIGRFMSEVLTVGFADAAGQVVLFKPDRTVPNGSRLF